MSLPGFHKNSKHHCPMPNTLLRQHLQGPRAHPECAASPRPYTGKSRGIPLPWLDGDPREAAPSLGVTPGISHLQLCQPLAQGPGVEARWADPGCQASGHGAGSGPPVSRQLAARVAGSTGSSYQIRPGPRGLDRLKLRQSGGRPQACRVPSFFLLRMEPTGPTEPCPQGSGVPPTTKKPWRTVQHPRERSLCLGPQECLPWNIQKVPFRI